MTSSSDSFDLVAEGSARLLLTREQGRTLLTDVLERLQKRQMLVLSLEGVEAISPSFADELFGGLAEALGPLEFGKRVRIQCGTPAWRSLIGKVVAHRQHRRKAGATNH